MECGWKIIQAQGKNMGLLSVLEGRLRLVTVKCHFSLEDMGQRQRETVPAKSGCFHHVPCGFASLVQPELHDPG